MFGQQQAEPAYMANLDPVVKGMLGQIRNPSAKTAQVLQSITDRFKTLNEFSTHRLTCPDALIGFTFSAEPVNGIHNAQDIQTQYDRMIDSLDTAVKNAYEAAKRTNPSPASLYVKPIAGFEELNQILRRIGNNFTMSKAALDGVRDSFKETKGQFANQTLRKLDIVQRKHSEIQAHILKCVGLLEAYLYRTQRFARDNALQGHLDQEYQALEAQILHGPISTAILNQIKAEADEYAQQAAATSKKAALSSLTVGKLTGLLDEKKATYEELRSQVRRDVTRCQELKSELETRT
ncbi:MAG: uncharacterized protein KVP18_003723 [Porospora cf. gigantea A]|uniref:uncharacterized protein n=2 Tax=Porospora cf. gigantea A TaxID=2853593 RepID=UPI00355A2A89|nr:MAG: hypothetical protein KVP18_003723 [Porospora cf. gigantea A]